MNLWTGNGEEITVGGNATSSEVTKEDINAMSSGNVEWESGYYSFEKGLVVANTSFSHSPIIKCSDIGIIDDRDGSVSGDYKAFLSFWKDGVYVGWYLYRDDTYKNAAQTTVDSIEYDSFALTVSSGNERNVKFKNLMSNFDLATTKNKLSALKCGVMGDSITAGVGASSGKGFVNLLADDLATVTNYGVSATLVANEAGYSNSFVSRYTNMSDDLDVIIVYGGTNDWYHGTSFGDADSTDDTSFYGALNVLMQGLLTKYVGKEVIFVTPMSSQYLSKNTDNPNAAGKTMLDYRNAIMERCAHYAIPCIDLYAECGMDVAHNTAHYDYFSADGVHPNDAGHQRVHDRILSAVKLLIG